VYKKINSHQFYNKVQNPVSNFGRIFFDFFFHFLCLRQQIQMKTIKEIRNLLGLSQADMGEYLGVSQALASFAEAGKRSLPSRAEARLVYISNQIEAALASPAPARFIPIQQAQKAETKQAFEDHAIECQRKIKKLKSALKRLQPVDEQQSLAIRMPGSGKSIESQKSLEELYVDLLIREAWESAGQSENSARELLLFQIEMQEYEQRKALERAGEFG